MKIRHAAAYPALALALARNALTNADRGVRMLLLHDVPAGEMSALDRLVGHLARTGRLVDPAEAGRLLDAGGGGGKVLLTFDDGFASNLKAAQTVLARYGAKAIFFLCPGLMDLPPDRQNAAIASNIFDGRRRAPGLFLMGWKEAEALKGAGHTIGNHTLTHRRLTRLGADELEHEIGGGAEAIAARLGEPAGWFAFPFGDIDSVNATVLKAAGRHHRYCRSGVRGGNAAGVDRLALRADHVDLSAPWAYQRLVLEGGLDGRYGEARRRLDAMASEG